VNGRWIPVAGPDLDSAGRPPAGPLRSRDHRRAVVPSSPAGGATGGMSR